MKDERWSNRGPQPKARTTGFPAFLFVDKDAGSPARPHQDGMTLGPIRNIMPRRQVRPEFVPKKRDKEMTLLNLLDRARRVEALIEHYDRVGRYEERSGEVE